MFITLSHLSFAQDINTYLDKYDITPSMISQHPDGEWFISGSLKDSTPQLLKLTPTDDKQLQLDRLDYGFYQNISKLSNDGDHLLYAFADTIQDVRKTYLRTYKDGKLGKPRDFRKMTGLKALTYFMVDDNENVYFYTYAREPKGLYKISKQDESAYGEAELLIPNRPNLVPFSPLLLDENTMLLAQHGQDDQSVNGIYFSVAKDGEWQEPIKIDSMPYGWSLGFDENGDLIYINAKTKRIEHYNLEEIKHTINELLQ